MKLINKYSNPFQKDYYCDLTYELDKLTGIDPDGFWHHYILITGDHSIYIRIPGGTLGEIYVDNNNVITKITLDTNYVVKTYHADVLDQLQKYVGQKIEF